MAVMPDRPTHEAQLSDETRERLRAQHAEAVQRLVAAEALTLGGLRQVVLDAGDRLVSQVVDYADDPTGAQAAGRAAIRAGQTQLRVQFVEATRTARRQARTLAEGQTASELGAIQGWLEAAGSRERVPDPVSTDQDEQIQDTEEIQAESAGDSMAAAWALAALLLLAKWRRRGSRRRELAPALRGLARDQDWRVRRHAASQAVGAYQVGHAGSWPSLVLPGARKPPRGVRLPPDWRRELAREMRRAVATEIPPDVFPVERPPVGLPHGWRSGVADIWSAILDRATCATCAALDGQIVPHGKPFPGGFVPDVHPACRCVVITAFLPESVGARMTSIEGAKQVKREVMDHFRGAKLEELEVRRAEGYIRGSQRSVDRQLGAGYRAARERRKPSPLLAVR